MDVVVRDFQHSAGSRAWRSNYPQTMGTWRYVVSLEPNGDCSELEWGIREIHSTEDGQFGYTARPVKPFGTSYEDLLRDLDHMLRDSSLEVLDLRGEEPRLVAVEQIQEEFAPGTEPNPLTGQWEVPGALCEPINGRPRIVCICGSIRFHEEANSRLTLAGAIVLAPALFQRGGEAITEKQRRRLSELQLKKIDLADAILVLDPKGVTSANPPGARLGTQMPPGNLYSGSLRSQENDLCERCGKPTITRQAGTPRSSGTETSAPVAHPDLP